MVILLSYTLEGFCIWEISHLVSLMHCVCVCVWGGNGIIEEIKNAYGKNSQASPISLYLIDWIGTAVSPILVVHCVDLTLNSASLVL